MGRLMDRILGANGSEGGTERERAFRAFNDETAVHLERWHAWGRRFGATIAALAEVMAEMRELEAATERREDELRTLWRRHKEPDAGWWTLESDRDYRHARHHLQSHRDCIGNVVPRVVGYPTAVTSAAKRVAGAYAEAKQRMRIQEIDANPAPGPYPQERYVVPGLGVAYGGQMAGPGDTAAVSAAARTHTRESRRKAEG